MARIFVPSWLRVSLIESANPAQLVSRHFRDWKNTVACATERDAPSTVWSRRLQPLEFGHLDMIGWVGICDF